MHNCCQREEIAASYDLHVNTIYRVCYIYFRQKSQDIEDAVQTTFLKRIGYTKIFENSEHERAWLIRTASNVCKDMLKRKERKNISIDGIEIAGTKEEYSSDEMIDLVLALPPKYKFAMYLFYYEGYSCKRIAQIMKKSEGTIWNYLHCGRKRIKAMIQGELL
jgi:RNA polymerase sigma factor (sigma-70 family)